MRFLVDGEMPYQYLMLELFATIDARLFFKMLLEEEIDHLDK